MTVRRSRIIGCGSYLPERLVTNEDLTQMVDTSDDWIRQRTGILQRHLAADGEKCSDLAIAASRSAIERAGIDPARGLDLIVMATTTPDQTFPATAARVQAGLGMTRGAAFDVQAVCSGFVFATTVADNFIRMGQAETVLVVGAETYSRILDWDDRGTCVLFGDGAGAIVLAAAAGDGSNRDTGILATRIHTDGRQHDMLYVDGGVSTTQTAGFLRMNGKEVFKNAVTNLSNVAIEAMAEVGLTIEEVDWLVPHQANLRILEAIAKRIGLPPEQVVITVDRHANTSAASVPLALDEAVTDGRIKPGDLVLMEAMGGGFSWGAALVRM
jgi:3-oxoacyl-[acyl-carrier-protein] synthase-3